MKGKEEMENRKKGGIRYEKKKSKKAIKNEWKIKEEWKEEIINEKKGKK